MRTDASPLLAHVSTPGTLPARDLRGVRAQALFNQSFLDHLFGSLAWRASAVVREPRRWLPAAGCVADNLIPWHDLESDGPGRWEATGPEPAFLAPCFLPAGWLSIGVRGRFDGSGRMALYAQHSGAAHDASLLDTAAVRGDTERTLHVRLDRPAIGLRWEPLDAPGRFTLDKFHVRPLTPPQALLAAVRAKRELLGASGLTGQALGNAAKLLLRGEWRAFAGKLFGGLTAGAPAVSAGVCRMYGPAAVPGGERRGDRQSIVYVLKSAGLCGGVKVVLEHVSRLYERGHDACVYFLDAPPTWFDRPVPAVQFGSVAALQAALDGFRGVKVATWYETAPWVAASLRDGDRGYYLVQDIESSYGDTASDADAALATYRLGLTPISEGTWVDGQLRERFGLSPAFVSIGFDHDIFRPRPVEKRPLTLLTQARTWSGGVAAGRGIKGWDVARAVVERVSELVPGVGVETFSIETAPRLVDGVRHTHYQAPTDETLACLYSGAGLFLLTSRHEGFGLTAAEAMACGCPVVATRAQGNEEFCVDEETALTAEADDVEALAQHCRRVLEDWAFADELAERGRARVQAYQWDVVVDRLERLFGAVPPAAVGVPAALPTARSASKGSSHAEEPLLALRAVGNAAGTPFDADDGEHPAIPARPDIGIAATVIIPTVNDVRLTALAIATARQHSAGRRVEFVVVDDGTPDAATRAELRQACKELGARLFWNRQNLGFSATVNRGLRAARGRLAVLCNNDIVFTRPWLDPLEAAFAGDRHLGVVGARLLYPDGTLQHAGMDKEPGGLRFTHAFGRLPGDHPPALKPRLCWAVTGALFAIRADALPALGGFSTAYATAWEDVDYCLHAWGRGYRVGYAPAVVATHLEGGTRGATPVEKARRAARWAEREAAGERTFRRKWAGVERCDDLRPLIAATLDREATGFVTAQEPPATRSPGFHVPSNAARPGP